MSKFIKKYWFLGLAISFALAVAFLSQGCATTAPQATPQAQKLEITVSGADVKEAEATEENKALDKKIEASERLAVEAAQAADDPVGVVGLLALAVQLRELQGALVGFGAGVTEEGVLQLARGDHAEQLAGVAAHGVEQFL